MNKKITQFPQIITRNNDDWLLIEEAASGAYKRIKVSDFIAGLSNTSTPGTTPSTTAYKDRVLASSPWLYYRLNDSSGSTALDASGAIRNGTYYGSPVFGVTGSINGDVDKAVSFNGSTGIVANTFGASAAPDLYSIEFRFKTTLANAGIAGFNASSNTANSGTYDRELSLIDGKMNLYVYAGSAVNIITTNTFNDGLWHTATQKMSSAGTEIWIDGTLQASSNITSGASYSGYWRIGFNESKGYFNGVLDEFSVTYSALTSTEIQTRHSLASA
jgi:hypothetical protein